ncbi:RNA polymerase sigma-70 factor (ECF subfamily) [Dyadobacter jejuensis]|uniref:RNA polymerase sigma-70 factor (ECF subfamily) n=1 Tax=Dyadobacter jejuensis TaxID=1082580 RepID=A0A316ARN7_9BACT|nr:sigma-70 family RNA polymerase sigma factor [Dyadobacter jejuensis]PWJ60168.1 RNA polymerase sigma-70 factor (ECF subfamily) [Dyadobacter jejuensis]
MGRVLAFFNQDAQLVKALRQGNAKAQRQLYDRYAAVMLGLCTRYVGDGMHAEDIMIEGLMKVFTKIEQYSGEGSLDGWIRRIMVNEALGYLRKNKKSMEENLQQTIDVVAEGYDTDADLEVASLMKLVHELPVGYKTVFNLYAIEGYSHKEIAVMLEISESTSKSQLHRARALLQKQLLEMDKDFNKMINHEKASD